MISNGCNSSAFHSGSLRQLKFTAAEQHWIQAQQLEDQQTSVRTLSKVSHITHCAKQIFCYADAQIFLCQMHGYVPCMGIMA
jgi:hypothetical protein